MLKQVSREALLRLREEAQHKNFTPAIISRLKNENPGYAYLANFFANKAKSDIGDAGFRLALEHFAISYRIFELSDRYPDKPSSVLHLPEADPLETAAPGEIASARDETNEFIKRLQMLDGKWPHEPPR